MTLEETYTTLTGVARELKVERSFLLDLWTQGKLPEGEPFYNYIVFKKADIPSIRDRVLSVPVLEEESSLRI